MNRELDAKIAEKTFGYKVEHWTQETYKDADPSYDYVTGWVIINEPGSIMHWRSVPRYSSNMSDAWKVVERMTQLPSKTYEAREARRSKFMTWFEGADLWAYIEEEAAKAICENALRIQTDTSNPFDNR